MQVWRAPSEQTPIARRLGAWVWGEVRNSQENQLPLDGLASPTERRHFLEIGDGIQKSGSRRLGQGRMVNVPSDRSGDARRIRSRGLVSQQGRLSLATAGSRRVSKTIRSSQKVDASGGKMGSWDTASVRNRLIRAFGVSLPGFARDRSSIAGLAAFN